MNRKRKIEFHANLKLSFLAVLLFTTACFAASEINSIIFLNMGDSIPFTVSKINTWGVTNEKGETASFSVMDSLFISDSSMAYKIIQIDNRIEIKQKSDGFLINFVNFVAPTYIPRNSKPFTPKSISVSYHYDSKSRIGFQFEGNLFNSNTTIFRFHASIGFSSNDEVYSNFNLACGLGHEIDYDDFLVSFVTSYGKYGGDQYESSVSGISSVIFFTFIMGYQLKNKYNLYMFGGFDLFLYHSQKKLPEKPYTIFLGLGKELK